MNALDLARLQFGATTVYHFIFVPLTIGLSPLVAIMQTQWYRTQDVRWYRLTKFFGRLLLINFAIGVATGIVQEFQFGMNWSEYSRYVGDVFGAPLAMEGLAAFFLESTFLGLWIFGWDRLPRKVHLACAWLFSIGTWLSAYFILAANSFMQHPVGVRYNPETKRAELESIATLLGNPTTVRGAFPHTIGAALLVAGTFVAGIALWWMVKSVRQGHTDNAATYRKGAWVGLIAMVIAGATLFLTGDQSAKLMFQQQPMKMAAAEGLCRTESGVDFSILAIGNLSNNCEEVSHVISLPGVTSFLADGNFNSTLKGAQDLQAEAVAKYGATDKAGHQVNYTPDLAGTYWSFRLMMGFAVFSGVLALAGLWLTRSGRTSGAPWLGKLAILALPMPFLGTLFGWIFTEIGRQPWVVVPNPTGTDPVHMLVADGVSNHPAWLVWTSLLVFVVLYGALAVVWYRLMKRYATEGLMEEAEPQPLGADDSAELHFAY